MNIEDIKDAFEALTEREKHFVSDIINNIHGIDIESIKIPEIQAEPDPVIEEPEIISKKIEQDDGFDEFDEDFIEPENPVLTVAKDEFDEDFDEDNSYHEDYFAVVAWKDELYRYFEVVKQNEKEVIR